MFRFRILALNLLSSLKVMIDICYLEILSLAVKQLMRAVMFSSACDRRSLSVFCALAGSVFSLTSSLRSVSEIRYDSAFPLFDADVSWMKRSIVIK